MPKIRNKEDLKKYLCAKLGTPIHNVEVDDMQFEIIIDDAVEYFQEQNYGQGNIESYAVFPVVENVREYVLRNVDDVLVYNGDSENTIGTEGPFELLKDTTAWEETEVDIQAISRVQINNGNASGINNLFSNANIWWNSGGSIMMDSLYGSGYTQNVENFIGDQLTATFAFKKLGYQPFMPLTNFVVGMQQIDLIESLFKTRYDAIWRKDAGILQINPTPQTNTLALLSYYKKENPKFLYGNRMVKKLCLGESWIQLANNLGKYDTKLVGDGSINVSDMRSNGEKLREEALEEIKLESEPNSVFIID